MTHNTDTGFIIEDKTPRSCETIHKQCKDAAIQSLTRYINNGGRAPNSFACGACGEVFKATSEETL